MLEERGGGGGGWTFRGEGGVREEIGVIWVSGEGQVAMASAALAWQTHAPRLERVERAVPQIQLNSGPRSCSMFHVNMDLGDSRKKCCKGRGWRD